MAVIASVVAAIAMALSVGLCVVVVVVGTIDPSGRTVGMGGMAGGGAPPNIVGVGTLCGSFIVG